MRSARRNRVAGLAVTAAALVPVAACGTSSNVGNPTSSAGPTSSLTSSVPSSSPVQVPPPSPPTQGKDHVEGLVEAVSIGAIQLKTRSGAARVDFTPSTLVTEAGPAQLTDVTAGSCVSVHAAPGGAPGAITAESVTISPATDGKCLPPPEAGPGATPPAAPPPAAPTGVFGQVNSVSGDTVVVNGMGPGGPGGQATPTNVTVSDKTTYTKDAVTNDKAIQNGKCLAAQGTEGDGALQATAISLQPCPPMGGPHHQIPHLPLHIPLHRK